MYRIVRGLFVVGVCGLVIWVANKGLFSKPDTRLEENDSYGLPISRSLVEFDEAVFAQAVSLSNWAELKGSTLYPKEGMEGYFRAAVNPDELASRLTESYSRKYGEWDESAPSFALKKGHRQGYRQIPTWVLWAFHSELQGL